VRVPCNAGDFAVIVTPGNGCPSDDLTVPEITPVWTPCAEASVTLARTKTAAHKTRRLIILLLL